MHIEYLSQARIHGALIELEPIMQEAHEQRKAIGAACGSKIVVHKQASPNLTKVGMKLGERMTRVRKTSSSTK